MKNVEERAKYDDYEMLEEYDFSDGVRGRFYEPKKVPTSMKLHNDILIFLKNRLLRKNSLQNKYKTNTIA